MARPIRLCLTLLATGLLGVIAWQSAQMQAPLRRLTITTEEGISLNPSMSGDGRIVAFESTEDIAGAGGFEGFRAIRADVSVDPATFHQMGGTRAPAPAISQDGSRIAFSSKDNPLGTNNDSNPEIFLHDGAKLIQVTNTSPADIAHRVVHGNFLPSISDDGRFIAFSSNRNLADQNSDGNFEIFVLDTVDLSFTQLTDSAGIVGATDAKISGDGAHVAYIRDSGATPAVTQSEKRDLVLQSRLDSASTRVLASEAQKLFLTYGRAISDDGARVVYAAETAANSSQVFLYDGRNNVTRQVTSLGTRVTDVPLHATINGNGSKIAFATRRSFLGNSDGGVDLYTFDIPSSTSQRVTSAPSTATAEVLSSLNDDGSVIAFNFPRVLTGVSNEDFANNSEIYITGTPARPAFGPLTILNGASFGREPASTQAVAPDSVAVARGNELAKTTEQSKRQPDGSFPLTVGGTTVTVNGRPAQIFFVSPTQVNFHVPAATEIGSAEVIVTNGEGFPSRGTVSSLRAAPGVFTYSGEGLGDGVILDAQTLQAGPFDPSSGNLTLIIFSTGVRNGLQISVTAGGRALTFESVVASPNMPGLDELRVRVPRDLRGAGKVELVVRADGRDSNPVSVTFSGDSHRDIVINEFLSDPPGSDAAALNGDANHDGTRDSGDDEFVELVNNTTHDIDISGYQILSRSNTATSDTLRHTFASGTILPGCAALVVFGGGNPDPANPVFGGAQIRKASSGGLSLSNTGGAITLRDPASEVVNLVSYGSSTGLDGNADQSLTRSPEVTGSFTLHQTASGSGGTAFSPGTRVNGAPFSSCPAISRIEVSPASTAIDQGAKQQFTAQAYDANNQPVSGVIFFWQSSDPAVATIDQSGLATGLSAGTTGITATGRGIPSPPAILTVRAGIPPLLVISQVYGGGGNSGAAYKNDFIEIFNRGTTTVDLAGWSVQQASATGTSWSVTPLCSSGSCLLAPGKYFLVQESSGGAVGADLPAPDAIGTSNLAATSGKIALVNNTTPLSGSGCPFTASVIDFVGYGTTANCFEGTGHAPAPSATNSDLRLAGGCIDTNENSADFATGTPNPRNSAAAVNDCSAPPPTPTPTPTPTPSPSPGLAPPVVISEFRTRGPNGASDEFIEIYNNSDSAVDIGGWKIKGSSASGATITNKLTVNAGTMLPARGHFLATNSAGYSGSVAGDQTFTSGVANDGGVAVTLPDDTVVDQVGMSATSAFLEGMHLAPLPSDANQSYERKPGGASGSTQDTGDNFNDFQLLSPSDPQNLASAPTPGGTPAPTPTPSPTASPTPVLTSVTISPTSVTLDIGQTQQFTAQALDQFGQPIGGVTINFASNNAGVATVDAVSPTSGTGSATATVTGRLNGTAGITATANNGGGVTVTSTPATVTVAQVVNPGEVLISEFRFRGSNGANDEFIELYNPTTHAIDISGFKIFRSNNAGARTAHATINSGVLLQPGCHYLLTNANAGGPYNDGVPGDQTYSTGITDDGGIAVTLASGTDSTGILDQVGLSSGSAYKEGTELASLGTTNVDHSYERKPGGAAGNGTDTNNNSADFFLNPTVSNPQNLSTSCLDLSTADLSITKSDSPDPVITGSNVTYTIVVTNNGAGTAQAVVVTDNLPGNVTFVSCGSTGGGVCNGSGNNRTVNFASLASGAVETITLVATATGAAGTTITNNASVSSSTNDPNSGNNSAQSVTSVINQPAADLSISKADSIDPVAPGGALSYTLTVTNNGPDAASSIVVTDNLPSEVTFVDCTSDQDGVCGGTSTNPTVSFSSLANGATATITIRVTVSNALTTGAVISNTASLTSASTDSNASNDTDTETTAVHAVNAGDVLISEFRFRGSNGANDEFIELYNPTTRAIDISGFKIFRSNNAGTKTLHATISSGVILPPGCHYLLTNANAGGPYNDGVPGDQTYSTGITDDGGIAVTLASGTDSTGILDQVGLSSGSAYKENTPLASLGTTNVDHSYERKPGGTAGNGTDTNNNSADFFVNPTVSNPQNLASGCLATNTADLAITKTDSPDPVLVGADITYTITVTNNGIGASQNVVVTDNLPSSLTFVSCNSTSGGVCDGTGNDRTVTFSSLAVGSSATITLVATVNGSGGASISNTASVSSDTTDPNSSNDSVTITTAVSEADLSITKSDSPDPVNAGENITYTLTVTNNSATIPAQNVTVSDQVPANTTLVSVGAPPTGWTRTDATAPGGTGTITFNRLSMPATAPDNTAIFTFTVMVDAGVADNTTISNTAGVTSDTPDDVPANNSATETTTVRVAADLSLVKTVDDSTPNVGEDVTFTLTLTNGGPFAASGITVKDTLPAGLLYVSSAASQGTYDSGTGVWTIGTVADGASATLSITATVETAPAKTNTAEVTASSLFDPDSTPNNQIASEDDQSSVTVTPVVVVAQADLSLLKNVNNVSPNIGERVVFTIELSNSGDAAGGVEVEDLLPAGLAYVSSTVTQGTYNSGTGVWTVGSVSAGSPAATLTITATVLTVGAITNTAEVSASTTQDPDSTPNDGSGDDFDTETVMAASNLVINEVHTQAQTSPPANSNDFVELFNKSAQAIDISGLVIYTRASNSTTTPNTFTLPSSTVIQPNSYLIIVNGTITYGVAADFDASGSGFNLTAASGGVKIELNGVKLDGLAYQISAANVVSPTFAAFGEGTVFISPVASGQQDYVRSPNGADSNNNVNDFRRSGANSTTVTPKAVNPTISP